MMHVSKRADLPVLKDILRPGNKQDGAQASPVDKKSAFSTTKKTRSSRMMSADDWEKLELSMRMAVLNDLQTDIYAGLQRNLESKMTNAIEAAMLGLTTEMKNHLKEALNEAIRQTVAKEIALVKASVDEIADDGTDETLG